MKIKIAEVTTYHAFFRDKAKIHVKQHRLLMITLDQKWLQDLEDKCPEFQTYYVAVDIPLDVLEQREETRGTSPKGHARSNGQIFIKVHHEL